MRGLPGAAQLRRDARVSVVSAIYNKTDSLAGFVRNFARQNYAGNIELVLVDDCSTDGSPEMLEALQLAYAHHERLIIRLLRNSENLGNCGSRNRGLGAATGAILIVMDGDCYVNVGFVAEHVRAHTLLGYDVCIGPMGIQSEGRNIDALMQQYLDDPALLAKDMRLQFIEHPAAADKAFFVNCVTRNFSVSRAMLDRLAAPLFDELFSYSKRPDSGFGWEDVEMGYRLYQLGARMWFTHKAIAIHKTHPPEISDREKAPRSLENFRRLVDKHPDIVRIAPDWAEDTFGKIEAWVRSSGLDRCDDLEAVRALLQARRARIPNRTLYAQNKKRRRILTYRWHVGHQYDLWKIPHDFTLSVRGEGLIAQWDYKTRPLPFNARFARTETAADLRGHDLAILHFDEFVLRPELARGYLSKDWGDQFKFLMENFDGPKVAVCHGVPVYKGACQPEYDGPDLGAIIDEHRQKMVDYLHDTLVICNSHQAQREWGFKNSKVIWQGFDPLLHAPCTGDGILTAVGQIRRRHHYRGYALYLDVMKRLNWQAAFFGDDLPNAITQDKLHHDWFASRNELGLAYYRQYLALLGRYGIFFNPTLRSPMPRTRGEAMMSGLALVTCDNHDASMFIDNGYNGYLCDDAEGIAAILTELAENRALRKTIGRRGRETALQLFHVNRFNGNWQDTVEFVLAGGKGENAGAASSTA